MAAVALAGPCGLAILGMLLSLSCSQIVLTKTGMITPNAYSESIGKEQMSADVDECDAWAADQRERLLEELLLGDPEVVERLEKQAKRDAKGEKAAEFFTPENASSAKEDLYGAIGALTWDILFGESRPDADDEEMLANYLGIEGGISGFSAEKRLEYICLRGKGYRVKDDEEDGAGTPYLVREPAKVMLREKDGTEKRFYGYLAPSRRGENPLDPAYLEQYGGTYSVDCEDDRADRLKVLIYRMVFESKKEELVTEDIEANVSYWGNSPPEDFEIAFTGTVKKDRGLLFLVYGSEQGPYIQMDGDPKILKGIGRAPGEETRYHRCWAGAK
jgi:hypothetical protein